MKRAHRYSETRSRSTVNGECTNTQNNVIKLTSGIFWLYSLNMTILGDSDDICDPKGHIMCPMNFRPPPWILLLNALTYDARAPSSLRAHMHARTHMPICTHAYVPLSLSLSHTHTHIHAHALTRKECNWDCISVHQPQPTFFSFLFSARVTHASQCKQTFSKFSCYRIVLTARELRKWL